MKSPFQLKNKYSYFVIQAKHAFYLLLLSFSIPFHLTKCTLKFSFRFGFVPPPRKSNKPDVRTHDNLQLDRMRALKKAAKRRRSSSSAKTRPVHGSYGLMDDLAFPVKTKAWLGFLFFNPIFNSKLGLQKTGPLPGNSHTGPGYRRRLKAWFVDRIPFY